MVYVIDSLRPDRLGAYGHESAGSPRIDAFARTAVRFDAARAQSSWTKSSIASLLTGVWPPRHGANRHPDRLAAGALSLAEVLRAEGFYTAGLSANPNITAEFGFDQGFDEFAFFGRGRRRSTVLNESLPGVLDRAGDRRLFVYLHTIDPHTPYAPPDPYRQRFAADVEDPSLGRSQTLNDLEARRLEASDELTADLLALYDGEIAANDASFGALLDLFRQRGLADDTLWILVSDHGEEFNDHGGWTHGKELFDESLRIPLLIGGPGLPPATISTPVQHVDLLPTLLDLLAIEPLPDIEGTSLVPLMRRAEAGPEATAPARPQFAYLRLSGPPRASVVLGNWKLIERYPPGRPVQQWLFNLAADPGETENLADLEPEATRRLSALLAARLAEPPPEWLSNDPEEPALIDDRIRDELEDLGYIN